MFSFGADTGEGLAEEQVIIEEVHSPPLSAMSLFVRRCSDDQIVQADLQVPAMICRIR
jgi:hypothetical protein